MSTDYKLDLDKKRCWLEYTDWGPDSFFGDDVTLCYINESTDHWSTSYEVEVYIDEAKAKEIVEFLKKKYPNI